MKAIHAEIMETYYKRKLGDFYEKIESSIFKKALKKNRPKRALLKMLHEVTPTQKHLK